MVSNNSFFDVLGRLRGGVRAELRRLRNTRHVKGSERDLLFSELPQNPLRIVEFAARAASRKHGWERAQWGVDDDGCWVRNSYFPDEPNYYQLIDRADGGHEAEILAALDLLTQIVSDRNN